MSMSMSGLCDGNIRFILPSPTKENGLLYGYGVSRIVQEALRKQRRIAQQSESNEETSRLVRRIEFLEDVLVPPRLTRVQLDPSSPSSAYVEGYVVARMGHYAIWYSEQAQRFGIGEMIDSESNSDRTGYYDQRKQRFCDLIAPDVGGVLVNKKYGELYELFCDWLDSY